MSVLEVAVEDGGGNGMSMGVIFLMGLLGGCLINNKSRASKVGTGKGSLVGRSCQAKIP